MANPLRKTMVYLGLADEEASEENRQTIEGLPELDENGKAWTALYAMERQPDGSWKIVGCQLLELPGADV